MKPNSNDPRGSIWRKWDLHIHTPASFHWNDGPSFREQNGEEKKRTVQRIVEKINSTDVAVFGVMDYWTFEGYFEIRRFCEAQPGTLKKTVLPGIELRLEAPTDFRLNTHVLFSDTVSEETLTTFVHTLRCGGALNKPPTREVLTEIGRSYGEGKLQALGFKSQDRSDDQKMLLAGAQSVVITRTSLREAIKLVGEDRCLLIQPYDTNDGAQDLDWKCHPYDDQDLMRWAHIFEAKHPVHVSLFLGLGHPKAEVQRDFLHNLGGCPKPAFRGSDAHKIADYGKFPNDRIAWLKADPTFLGLKQVCHEPAERCFVGLRPPKLEQVDKHPTKYIRSLSIERAAGTDSKERWFDGVNVELNPGLIAIIGNKGSGKSALADILALLGNTRTTAFEFLNPHRFRKGKTRAQQFKGELTWEDGKKASRTLDKDPDSKEPERVRYLPQSAIEKLCNELASDGPSDFEGELKKVIFSHVPKEQQMGKESLDHLLGFKTGPSREAVRQLQVSLSSLNATIVELERQTGSAVIESYRNSLALKSAELDAHTASEPKPPSEQPGEQSEADKQTITELTGTKQQYSELTKRRDELKAERVALFTRQGKLESLTAKIQNLARYVDKTREDISGDAKDAGVSLDALFQFSFDTGPLEELRTGITKRVNEITLILDGDNKSEGLENAIKGQEEQIRLLQNKLDAPAKAQQEYLAQKASWEKRRAELIGAPEIPDSKMFFEAKIKAATEDLPKELSAHREKRRQIAREVHQHLVSQRHEYEQFYKPVQQIATDSPFKSALKLDFAVFLSPTTFQEQFLSLVNRQRRGPFQGEEDGAKKVHDLLSDCNFSNAEDVLNLLEGIITGMGSSGGPEVPDLPLMTSQLRKDVKLHEFYDFLFSLKYIEPRYTLRLDGKEISELSPGEKGALLLVFYLLLDQEEIPIIIDQPEHNLDNESVVRLLVNCIRRARDRRQVILVTHNPNLAIVCDADQIVSSKIDKGSGNLITYETGAIENPSVNLRSIDVLEGTFPAFDNRRIKWMKPSATV